MRSILTVLLLLPLCLSVVLAQSPPYINYQGVARDRNGTVLQDHALSLRISILKDSPSGNVAYSERHVVTTNDFGMFTLQIGGGELRQGAIDALAWGKNSYWMQVEMDENGGNVYTLLGSSQLLSVPYAFHALHANEADRVAGSEVTGGGPGASNGSPWSTRGNEGTDAMLDYVGTSDPVDLVFKTDEIERMRFSSTGNIGIGTARPVSTLDVKGNVTVGENYAGVYAAPQSGMLVEGHMGIGEPYPNASLEVNGEFIVGANFTGVYLPPLNGALFEGRVGIGTVGPGSMLSVKGGVSVGNKFSENAAPTNGAAIEGKVGIGTTIPQSLLGVAGNTSIGSEYARSFQAPINGLIVQGDVGLGTESPLSRLGVAGSTSIGFGYASSFPAPEDGLMVEGPLWAGVTESEYKFHVLGNSFLDGTMQVTGNTAVGGTLDVDGVTTLHDVTDVPVIHNSAEKSDASFNGSLHVKGGAGVEKNLNVGVDIGVAQDAFIGRDLKVGGTADFKNLVVQNYADIGSSPDPNDTILNTQPFPRTFINKGETELQKKVDITDITQSSSATNGALVVAGGVGIQKNLNVGGQATVKYTGSSNQNDKTTYPFFVSGTSQGMAVQLNTGVSNSNTFVGFWDGSNQKKGSIDGETLGEHYLTIDYAVMTLRHVWDVAEAAVELVSDVADFRAGAGFGVVVVTPGVSKIVKSTAAIILLAVEVILEQKKFAEEWGVTFNSGGADYAEWLEREDPNEQFVFGDIVGVRAGKISRNIEGAEMVFVISKMPIVLGNTPPAGREHLYEKCAFLGQVPVKVVGPVSPGDYIIPSGKNNGLGYAVNPSDITAKQCVSVVGMAWGSLEAGKPGYVNVAVGMPIKSSVEVLVRQQDEISALELQVGAMESMLREMIPDLDTRLARFGYTSKSAKVVDPNDSDGSTETVLPDGNPNPDMLTDEMFVQAINVAKDEIRARGHDPASIQFMVSLENDGAFRSSYLGAIKDMIRTGGDRTELQRVTNQAH